MRKLWLILSFGLLSICCSAQTGSVPAEQAPSKPKKANKGTYQFIIAPEDTTSVFTDDILVVIENLRDRNKVVYYDASPTVRVKILPMADINRPDFHPLPEWVVLKDE